MSKKARRGLSGSLGFRVLSISCIFLAIPLVIYSLFLYFIDYRQYVKNIFEEVDNMSKEELAWIHEKEIFYGNTITLIEEFIVKFHLKDSHTKDDELSSILRRFTMKQDVSAIIYAEVSDNNQIICKSSTVENYVGIDFSHIFTNKELDQIKDNILIAKDPFLGYSMYILKFVDSHGVDAYIMTIISLKQLISQMGIYQQQKGLDISIIDQYGNVLVSTNKDFEGYKFSDKPGNKTFVTKPITYIKNGRTFKYKNQKNFFDVRPMPKSETFLVFSVSEESIMGTFQTLIYKLGFFLLVVLIVGGVITFSFTLRMAKPMGQLTNVMDKVGSGDLEVLYQDDKYGFEINKLGDSFNQMTHNLLEHIEAVKKEKGMKEAFEKELQIGHEIQRALLPSHEEKIDGVDLATFYSPAKEVAGDFYDYNQLGENRSIVTIADGVGKGISSCLYSFAFRSILKTAVLEIHDLDELVVKTNNIFLTDTKESCNFVTAIIGFLDTKAKTYQFTNAGHLPVMVKRKDGRVELFATKGIALGINELESVELETIPLEEGDYCVLYTDGVTEAQNAKNELFTDQKLIDTIANFDGDSSQKLVDLIMDEVQDFVADVEQYDDITLVVFKLQSS